MSRWLDSARRGSTHPITLLAETGPRASEAVTIRLDDLNGAWLVVRRGKGGEPRRVPVSPTLARATRRYLHDIRPPLADNGADSLLVAGHGGSWTAAALRRALDRRQLALAPAAGHVVLDEGPPQRLQIQSLRLERNVVTYPLRSGQHHPQVEEQARHLLADAVALLRELERKYSCCLGGRGRTVGL